MGVLQKGDPPDCGKGCSQGPQEPQWEISTSSACACPPNSPTGVWHQRPLAGFVYIANDVGLHIAAVSVSNRIANTLQSSTCTHASDVFRKGCTAQGASARQHRGCKAGGNPGRD